MRVVPPFYRVGRLLSVDVPAALHLALPQRKMRLNDSRSVPLQLNNFSFGISVDLGALLPAQRH